MKTKLKSNEVSPSNENIFDIFHRKARINSAERYTHKPKVGSDSRFDSVGEGVARARKIISPCG